MNRTAGILLPITSLPSPYGIGCFSQSAYDFVDWLKDAGQFSDAASGAASPTQTGQRSGELIAKGGMVPIGYGTWYVARSGKPSRAGLPKRWISPMLKPPLNCLLRGMPHPKLLSLATHSSVVGSIFRRRLVSLSAMKD